VRVVVLAAGGIGARVYISVSALQAGTPKFASTST
jgi:hypothetical protein